MLNRRRRFALLCCAPIGSRRRDLRPRPTLRNERTSTRRAASFGASDSKVARRRVKRGIACSGPTTRKKSRDESRRTSRDDEDYLGGEGARVGVASLDDTIVHTYLLLYTALTVRTDAQPRTCARLAGLATSTHGYMYVHTVEHGVIIVPVLQLKKEG